MNPECIIDEACGPDGFSQRGPVELKGAAARNGRGGPKSNKRQPRASSGDAPGRRLCSERERRMEEECHLPKGEAAGKRKATACGGVNPLKLIPTDLNQKADCLRIPITSSRLPPLSSSLASSSPSASFLLCSTSPL
ncbi:hypothetical protein SKAU_G00039700 [Synaphobranchus kaupii]|uniref:Uncharacterized protein n=1 Tax=Synaphobranchus kaupii TaxID=118154 RepID=A0A9Q1GI75_SYNKA|nr:hypothetical protein SKAU_G00039700 [Synaphobranchus kaupii]